MRLSVHANLLALAVSAVFATVSAPALALQCQTCEMPDPNDPSDNPPTPKSPLETRIDPLVWAQMLEDKLPGMTVAVTRNGALQFNKGYGYANTQTQAPMTANTRARIGSVTKAAITGPAGYQLMQAKGINPATRTIYGTGGVLGTGGAMGNRFDVAIGRGIARHTPIVEMDIGTDDHTYTWYTEGTYSEGATNDLDKYEARKPYTLPPSKLTVDVTGIAIAGNGVVYSWYNDARVNSTDEPRITRAIGTASDLDAYSGETETAVKLPPGKTAHDIVGIAIAKSNDHVFVWYQDGTVSEGTSMDFDHYAAPKTFTVGAQPSGGSYDIRAMGIASNDHVYAWFGNGKASSGTSRDLDAYIAPYAVAMPTGLAGNNWNNWYSTITIQNLLDHRAGFTRSGDTAGTAEMFGVQDEADLDYAQIHEHFLRTRPLLRGPGGNFEYSNHGFGLWTLLIEAMSGQTYPDYVRLNYLAPAGVSDSIQPQDATLGANDAANHDLVNGVPVPGAVEPSATGLAAGGYRGTARALTILTAKLDGKYGNADLDRMGWMLRGDGRLDHSGGATGGSAYVVMFPDGYISPKGKDLSNVHVAVVANRWGNLTLLGEMAREIAEQLP